MQPRLRIEQKQMKTDMQHHRSGKTLLVILVLLLSGCPKESYPPKIPVCTGDGVGGADCVLADGTKDYWPPSKLNNAWITTQAGMALFASWCYQITPEEAAKNLSELRAKIRSVEPEPSPSITLEPEPNPSVSSIVQPY